MGLTTVQRYCAACDYTARQCVFNCSGCGACLERITGVHQNVIIVSEVMQVNTIS